MFKTVLALSLLAFSSCLDGCLEAQAESVRQRSSLDFDWRFHLGDLDDAQLPGFDDLTWRSLDLPHDWSIEGAYHEDNPAGTSGAFLPTGIGWYRKHLRWEEAYRDKRVFLQFDGVYMNSEVWINGVHLGKRPYGYISFWYDLTDHLIEGDNVIAVRVDHSRAPSGRWYTGSGIYRHVWLTIVDPVHVSTWGTFVRSENITTASADLLVTTEVTNASESSSAIELESVVLDAGGAVVASSLLEQAVAPSSSVSFDQRLEIESPELWSPQHPTLYKIESIVRVDGVQRDVYETTTGIRKLEFTTERGFVLNDQPLEIQGMCMHHDAGPVGAAVPDDVLRRRLKLLKAMGVNAIRTAHNPFAPEFYAMADEMGFLVMNEAFDGWWNPKARFDYGNYFDAWWERDLTDFIKRDRNHPSVFMWSLGNEVRGWKPAQQKLLANFVRQLDSTRPITQGEGAHGKHVDVAGFNGHGEYVGAIESSHTRHPNKPIIGTEITHSAQTRGVYRTMTSYRTRDNPAPWERGRDNGRSKWEKIKNRIHHVENLAEPEVFDGVSSRYHSSYDNSFVRMNAREEIRLAQRLPYLLGTFRWTAFDYLGESFNWPARTDNFGVIDLAGFPKDHFYLYQSQWTTEPMVHMLPHWTHPGKEGTIIPVVVYTNQPRAELLLNGNSLGEQVMGEDLQLVWKVPYQPGKLKVIAKDNGTNTAKKTLRTAGEAAKIHLELDRPWLRANRRDVVHVEVTIVDDIGEPVPAADHLVEFEINGPGRLIGVENGDILDLASHKAMQRRAFQGKCLAIVQSTDETGVISIVARSSGLLSASQDVEVVQ